MCNATNATVERRPHQPFIVEYKNFILSFKCLQYPWETVHRSHKVYVFLSSIGFEIDPGLSIRPYILDQHRIRN